jgi:hypothetical protein
LTENQRIFHAVRLRVARRSPRSRYLHTAISALFLAVVIPQATAQSPSEAPDTIHGTVVNSVTHEPIPRALVVSPDNRFATMTDSQGRFEFAFSKAEASKPNPPASADGNPVDVSQLSLSNRPSALSARKPGFLEDDNTEADLELAQNAKEIALSLTPEAILAGQVSLPNSEVPDSIQLQLYRRQVQEGRAHWIPAGTAISRSTGEFRFAELHAGTYKLLTRELLDRDPLIFDPHGQLYGYPPVFYQDADGFDSATTIELSPGETAQAQISLVKQPYHNVKITVENALPGSGINVNVYSQGRNGPGYSLGYNAGTQTIDGMLPNGTYTVEATSFGPTTTSGLLTLNVKGAAVEGAHMVLAPASAIRVNVKEEFTEISDAEKAGVSTFKIGARTVNLHDPRRYLSLTLESADDFGAGRNASLGPAKSPDDESLVIENVLPGRYWVRVQSASRFAASVRSGTTDLQHEPLVVGAGGATSPLEITMRDDFATIDGTVEGIVPTATSSGALQPDTESGETGLASGPAPAHVYCIPMSDGDGEFARITVAPNGSFSSHPLAPGTYRVLAFEREQLQFEYRDPEAMKTYDNMGPVVHVASGQKEHVTLQLILTKEQP